MNKLKGRLVTVFILCSTLVLLSLGFMGLGSGDSELEDAKRHDTVIVGGGISGLTCGYYLDDEDFIILEKKGSVGGRTVSATHNSFTYAKGTEYLGTPESPLTDMIDELGLEPKEIPSPMDSYFDGKNFYYGHDGIKRYLINNSGNEEYKEFIELILSEYGDYDEIPDIDYNKNAEELDNISASEWLRDNGVPEVYIKKYNVSSKGLFGASLDEISALSFIPEAAYDYEDEDVEDLEDEDYTDFDEEDLKEEYEDATNEKSGSYSFIKGITELTDKLGEVLKDKIELDCNVVSITKKSGEYLVKYVDEKGEESIIIAQKVVLAVPAPEALRIAPTVLSEEKIDILEQIEYSSYATVALFSDEPIFDKSFDLAVPDDYFFTDIYDSTWVERYYDEEKSDIKGSIMSVYVAPKTSDDHSLDTMSEKELMNNIYKDLDKVFDSASSKITGYDIERFPYAYPVMSLGAYERLLELDELNQGSLILSGDYLVYPTFEAAVEAGYNAAEKILEEE